MKSSSHGDFAASSNRLERFSPSLGLIAAGAYETRLRQIGHWHCSLLEQHVWLHQEVQKPISSQRRHNGAVTKYEHLHNYGTSFRAHCVYVYSLPNRLFLENTTTKHFSFFYKSIAVQFDHRWPRYGHLKLARSQYSFTTHYCCFRRSVRCRWDTV